MENPAKRNPAPRQIVGFSLSPDVARAVKDEAEKRGITLKALFDDMWKLYRREALKGKS